MLIKFYFDVQLRIEFMLSIVFGNAIDLYHIDVLFL